MEKIKSHHAGFYVRAFNIEEMKWEYLNAKQDVLTALKASSTSSPYYADYVEISKKKYIDGSVINTRDFLEIVESNKDKKIILVLNEQYSILRTALTFPFHLIESTIFGVLYGNKAMLKNILSIFSYPTINEVSKYSNVHIIASDRRYSKICTDKGKLLELYNHGIEKGKDLLKNLQQAEK